MENTQMDSMKAGQIPAATPPIVTFKAAGFIVTIAGRTLTVRNEDGIAHTGILESFIVNHCDEMIRLIQAQAIFPRPQAGRN